MKAQKAKMKTNEGPKAKMRANEGPKAKMKGNETNHNQKRWKT